MQINIAAAEHHPDTMGHPKLRGINGGSITRDCKCWHRLPGGTSIRHRDSSQCRERVPVFLPLCLIVRNLETRDLSTMEFLFLNLIVYKLLAQM